MSAAPTPEPPGGPRRVAFVVRRQGRWWYPHELPLLPAVRRVAADHLPCAAPRLLVVTSAIVHAAHLELGLRRPLADDTTVFVVAPAFRAVEAARRAQAASVAALQAAGLTAAGLTGAADPLAAIADGLRHFEPDLILLFLDPSLSRLHRDRPLRCEVERRFARPVVALAAPHRTT